MDSPSPRTESPGPQTRPKRHHYLPKFYLDGFAADGLVALYDRERRELRKQAPKNTALENSFYSAQTDTGERFDDVEKAFALLESDAKPIVDRLHNGLGISKDQRDVIGMFAAAFFVRTPGFRRSTDNVREKMAKDLMRMAVGLWTEPSVKWKKCERLGSIWATRHRTTSPRSSVTGNTS